MKKDTTRIKKKGFTRVLKIISIIVAIFVISGVAAFFSITATTKLDEDKIVRPISRVTVYDNTNSVMEFDTQITKYTEFDDINPSIVDAFVAVEDKRFYSHNGIDYKRLAGAMLNNIKAGYFKEGGSTITQQLAKNAQLSGEKTFKRKLKEAKLAKEIENKFSKEEIITMYLNTIYFGNGLYGITEACNVLFDKEPKDITLPEAAILVGIVKNPAKNSPKDHPEKAEERKNLVLKVMLDDNLITKEEYNDAIEYKYASVEKEKSFYGYANAAISQAALLLNKTERDIIIKEYKIYTYNDKAMQNVIEKGFKGQSFDVEKADYSAMVCDNKTGGVTAYSASFSYSPFALRRQPGSVIKPLAVYAPALNAGYINPATMVVDEKTDFNGYSPNNYGLNYLGKTNIRKAVTTSSNVVAVKMLNEIGVDYGRFMANQMGLSLDEDDGLSLALGGLKHGSTMIEMCEGYMTLASKGVHKPVTFIKEIVDANGKTVFKANKSESKILSEESCYLMTDMLIDNAKYGTAKKLGGLSGQIASKTGTAGYPNSDQNSDAWNMSYTNDNTVCVWYGSLSNAKETRMSKSITGGSYPTLFAKYIYDNMKTPNNFDVPNGIIELELDNYASNEENTLLLASDTTPSQYKKHEIFDISYAPDRFSNYFDDIIPNALKTTNENDLITLSFFAKRGFMYKIIKWDGEQKIGEYVYNGESKDCQFQDKNPYFGMNRYTVEVYTKDGIFIDKSREINVYRLIFW